MSQQIHLTVNRSKQKTKMVKVLIITLLFMFIEIVAAYFSKSLALLADTGHMLTDVGALTLSLIAIWFAGRPATPEKTYGYYRSEILAGFINAFLLVIVSIYIITNGWQRLSESPSIESIPVFLVALLGLAVNLICLKLLSYSDGQIKSVNVKALYLEVFSDALASIGVIVSSLIVFLFHWNQADALMAIFIGFFILARTWNLLSECTNILMEGTPAHVNLELLRKTILALPGVESIHDMHVWTITAGLDAMSAHILISNDSNHRQVLNMVTEVLQDKFEINHTTIQIEQASCEKDTCS